METKDLREFKQRLIACVNKHKIDEEKHQIIDDFKDGYLTALDDIMSDLGLTEDKYGHNR